VAPVSLTNLVLLDDVATCAIRDVLVAGQLVREMEMPRAPAQSPVNTIRAAIPELRDLEGPTGMVHVIGVRQGRILTDRHVLKSDAPGVRRLAVLERHGKGSKPANGYVMGFGDLEGAIASSVGHDSHNLCVVGKETSDMRAALAALASSGGGFCVVRGGTVIAHLPLPIGGLMSLEEPETIARALQELHAASKAIGCQLPEPFLQLAFLSLPVIPSLKLTDRGLMDVDAFKLIDVRAA
jgi:adenine deaminase